MDLSAPGDNIGFRQGLTAQRISWCLDPAQGPPPDLVVEVDIIRRSIDRMKIYASMGIPEVWR